MPTPPFPGSVPAARLTGTTTRIALEGAFLMALDVIRASHDRNPNTTTKHDNHHQGLPPRSGDSMTKPRTPTLVLTIALALLIGACSQPDITLRDDSDQIARSSYQSPPHTIAQGLANPRGITVAPNGTVFVAEAGLGGDGTCFDGPEGKVCFGLSGAVTRIDANGPTRVIEGLPSLAGDGGALATGPHGISLLGTGNLYLTTGLGADPAVRDELLADSGLGMLWRANHTRGTVRAIADLAAFEATENPDGTAVDSNPYGVIAVPGGQAITDAGGNSVLFVNAAGRVETLAVLPPQMVPAPAFLDLPDGTEIPMESVPTSVARGPDGAYFVGVLTGFPFPVGGASVFRVVPGAEPTVYATGFTNIIDVTFGPDDALYVLEITTNGLLAASDPTNPDLRGALHRVLDGTTTTILGPDDGLIAPGGIAFGPRGELYITNLSVFPFGEVLSIEP